MKDVSDQVETGDIDGGIIVIRKCVCGNRWANWERTMSLEGDDFECEHCHRKLRASYTVKVEEVE
jgi:hypothetical protein